MAWDPDQYLRFRQQRRQPFVDLLALVTPVPGGRVVDLGCGTGELTRVVHQQLQAAETIGIDSSEAMLAKSEAHAGDGVSFRQLDIAQLDGRYDVVFSNAALHWLDDHHALLETLSRCVAPGGQIAIQVPANHHHPAHRVADETAAEEPFRSALGGYQRGVPVLSARAYAERFHSLGYASQQVRLQVYGHELPSRGDVVEWVKGALLTAFQKRLDEPTFERFVQRYRENLHGALPDDRPYFFTYDRILMHATRPRG
jgi:trans-aconitate 2-methyltransferase